ncbi:hypothetical protein AAFF_G00077270 [Aldrovandia affinis]|uniref:Coiled-coil domain-containing protein 87-like n=1 Tax=Aldrovandia affinis TaxID=143900 RepID=A0AAD7RXU8_9TELE|nr:hypothetical protein AAFF_G00077270 [Aldrovandia affinis]
MGASVQDIPQRYHSILGPLSLFSQSAVENGCVSGGVEEQCPVTPVLEVRRTSPASLSDLCHVVRCRIRAQSVPRSASQEDQLALADVLLSELGLVWHDLRALNSDPSLSREENEQLHSQVFSELVRVCEVIYLRCLRLLDTLRKRGVFSDQANLSRVRAQMIVDSSSLLNVHSIKRALTAGIKASRRERISAARGSDEHCQRGAPDVRSPPCRLSFALPPGSSSKKSGPSGQRKDAIKSDFQEINKKIEDLDLELVYDLMPFPVEHITNRGDPQCISESMHSTAGQKDDLTARPCLSKVKGYGSAPELRRAMSLELQTERSAPGEHIDPAEDLKRLLRDGDRQEKMRLEDPELDLPPLIKVLTRRGSTKLQLLQQTLQSMEEEEEEEKEERAVKKIPVEESEHPQAAVVDVAFSPKSIARTAAARVSDRVFTETVSIQTHPPICNDLTGEIELSSVQWLDRNLFTGAEITEVYRELSKSISTQHLNFDEDPMIEPALSDISLEKPSSAQRKTPCFINPELKGQSTSHVAQRRRTKILTEHERPQDVTSREYSAWLQWWKSHLSLEDYLKYISSQELDYLGVVFHLYDSDDEENEKKSALPLQQESGKKRRQKTDALRSKKQEFVRGVWNVHSVMLGGLGKEPVLDEDDSPNEDTPSNSKQEWRGGGRSEQGQEQHSLQADASGADQLQMRLEKIWSVLCFPDGLRQDMALKYSSDAYRDHINEAIVEWERIGQLIQQRETVLSQLEQFEKDASDPNRFFQHGYGGSSMARMDEARSREKLNSRISALEKVLRKAIQEIKGRFHDTVTYRGRPYEEKMRWDRTEMLYWLQQERRVQAIEKVVAIAGASPARLPPLGGLNTPLLPPQQGHMSSLVGYSILG